MKKYFIINKKYSSIEKMIVAKNKKEAIAKFASFLAFINSKKGNEGFILYYPKKDKIITEI